VDWKTRTLGIGVAVAPLLGGVVRLFTSSTAWIVVCGIVLWIYGATTMGYLARRLPSTPLAVAGRVLVWTLAPFLPLYAATVLATGALMKR